MASTEHRIWAGWMNIVIRSSYTGGLFAEKISAASSGLQILNRPVN
jgi:hypothetical protein